MVRAFWDWWYFRYWRENVWRSLNAWDKGDRVSVLIAALAALILAVLSALGVQMRTDDWDTGSTILLGLGVWFVVLVTLITPARMWLGQRQRLESLQLPDIEIEIHRLAKGLPRPKQLFAGSVSTAHEVFWSIEVTVTNTTDTQQGIRDFRLEFVDESERYVLTRLLPDSERAQEYELPRSLLPRDIVLTPQEPLTGYLVFVDERESPDYPDKALLRYRDSNNRTGTSVLVSGGSPDMTGWSSDWAPPMQ